MDEEDSKMRMPFRTKKYVIKYWKLVEEHILNNERYSEKHITKEEHDRLSQLNESALRDIVDKLAHEMIENYNMDWRDCNEEPQEGIPLELSQFVQGLLKVCWFYYIETRKGVNRSLFIDTFGVLHGEYLPQLLYSIQESIEEGLRDGYIESANRIRKEK